MVYFKKPRVFSPKFEAVSCYMQNSGKILLLKRQPHKPQGDKWGTPAGKIEKGETPKKALVREVFEETGIILFEENLSKKIKSYVVEPDYSFVWYMFQVAVNKERIRLREEEHERYLWVTPQEALTLDLALDEDVCIRNVFKLP